MMERTIRFTRGVPPVESFHPEQLAECAEAALGQHSDVILQYGPARGFTPLRQLLSDQVGADPERILLGQGSLQLLDLCVRVFIRPGDPVYVESPSYDFALNVLRRTGGRLVGFPLAEDGPDVDSIEARLKEGERPVLFYIISDFQNPNGTVLSLEKRQRIVDLARQYNFWIVEDSPYRKLRYRGEDVPALFELLPERVLLMSSYSKLICPGLRVGYMIAPQPLADRLAAFAEATYINASYLNQAIVYEYLRRGWLETNIEVLKQLYRPRLEAILDSLEGCMAGLATWSKPDGGFFVGLTLKGDLPRADLLARAEQANLLLVDGRSFFPTGGGDRFLRLPFCTLTPLEIQEGIARLAQVAGSLRVQADSAV